MAEPSDPPPSYEATTTGHHETRNGIPPGHRRSMEDENRPLPAGWLRQYDVKTHHQFFVDTKVDPPRAIWHHPYDDQEYLSTLDPSEREHVTRLHRSVSLEDMEAETSDDDAGPSGRPVSSKAPTTADSQVHGIHKYGRKLKDKITSTTHEEREIQRRKRAEEEKRAYEAHLAFRRAMAKAIETGQPQFVGKDRSGKEVYVEPPGGPPGVYDGGGLGGYGERGYGYNPHMTGPYANPNARFISPPPPQPYGRPYGYGYGGGLGMPLMGGMMGGMMGGALLGAALF